MKKINLKKNCIVFLTILLLITIYPSYLIIKITSNNYGFKTSINIIKNELVNFAINNEYSETFENAINSKAFNKNNINKYTKITFSNKKNFIKNINSLIKIGYSVDSINLIYKKLDYEQINYLIDHSFVKEINKYLEIDYFNFDDLDRYINYFNKIKSYDKTVLYVNIGLDKEYYKSPNTTKDFSQTMIVNKYNRLDESFVPPDIVKISSGCSRNAQYLSKIAADEFEKMCADSKKDKIYILANSSYRSYKSQKETYDYYYKLYGEKYVLKYVATPGFSEHQTGLAVDIASKNYSPFKLSQEYKWVIKNAYKYGFILRYPEKKEYITGFNPESWHFRYVGIDAAKYIYEKNITFEEYYAMFNYKTKK